MASLSQRKILIKGTDKPHLKERWARTAIDEPTSCTAGDEHLLPTNCEKLWHGTDISVGFPKSPWNHACVPNYYRNPAECIMYGANSRYIATHGQQYVLSRDCLLRACTQQSWWDVSATLENLLDQWLTRAHRHGHTYPAAKNRSGNRYIVDMIDHYNIVIQAIPFPNCVLRMLHSSYLIAGSYNTG